MKNEIAIILKTDLSLTAVQLREFQWFCHLDAILDQFQHTQIEFSSFTETFTKCSTICPIHCDHLKGHIMSITEIIDNFYSLQKEAKNKSILPISEEQSDFLNELQDLLLGYKNLLQVLPSLRSICLENTPETKRTRKALHHQIHTSQENLRAFDAKLKIFIDALQFQYRCYLN